MPTDASAYDDLVFRGPFLANPMDAAQPIPNVPAGFDPYSQIEPLSQIGSPVAAQGFDMSSVLPQAAPAAPPTPPGGDGKKGKRKGAVAEMALAVLAPIVAKRNGPQAAAALVNGFYASRDKRQKDAQTQAQTDFENQRQLAADQRAIAGQQAADKYRQDVLANQQQQQRAGLISKFIADVRGAETPDEVAAIRTAYAEAERAVGLRPGSLSGIASQVATPSALIERQVTKVIKGLKPETLEYYIEHGVSLKVPTQEQPVPFDVWSKYVTSGVDAAGKPVRVPTKPPTPNTPTEAYIADALLVAEHTKGGELTPEERLKVRQQAASDYVKYSTRQPVPRQAPGGGVTAQTRRERDLRAQLRDAIENPQAQTAGWSRRLKAAFAQAGLDFERAKRELAASIASDRATVASRRNALEMAGVSDVPTAADLDAQFEAELQRDLGGQAPAPAAGRGGRGTGAGPVGSPAPAAAPAGASQPRRASRADVEKVAQQLGISHREASDRLRSAGVVVDE